MAFAPIARGDVFILRGGGEVRGEWLNRDEVPKRSYLVKTESGIQVRLNASQVVERLRQSQSLAEYERIAPTFEDSVAGQERIAEWCRKQGLTQQRRGHLRRIVELDPKNGAAWLALGYTEMNGRWVTRQDFFEERGFVYFRGKWRLPQEIAVLEERNRVNELEREWIEQLKLWRAQLDSIHNADVAGKITSIDDPMAIRAISLQLAREKISQVRLLYLKALANIKDGRAWALVISTALRDPDVELFHECVEMILKMEASGVTRELTGYLKDSQNVRINRAAYLLGRLGDRKAIPALIDALVTTHTIYLPSNYSRTTATLLQSASNNSMTAMNGSPASGGTGTPAKDAAFTAGNSANSITIEIANQEVLQALIRLTGEQSFGFDEKGWSTWWALSSRSQTSIVPLPR